jgi:2-oxoglutarate ferredoxin oxidoreductase subunit alpha
MKGTEAIAEAAIRAGCRSFFGYPITPQNEIPEYMSKRLPQIGGAFVQAESEVAAVNMIYGAGGAGVRVMTSSSSPGVALMAEGFSYLVGAEVPVVIVNVMRGGPGLGGIGPSQSDYFMMTRGFGHGDQRAIVLAPSTLQEAVDLMGLAFDLADKYRNPTLLVGDGLIGQMMEPVTFPEARTELPEKSWATTGKPASRERNVINSLDLSPEGLERHVAKLFDKYARMEREEPRFERFQLDDNPPVCLCAYGTMARIAKSAVQQLRAEGIRVGLLRPITLWPFPTSAFLEQAETTERFICVELSCGQMVEDVRRALAGRRPVDFWGRTGGVVPSVEEIADEVRRLCG